VYSPEMALGVVQLCRDAHPFAAAHITHTASPTSLTIDPGSVDQSTACSTSTVVTESHTVTRIVITSHSLQRQIDTHAQCNEYTDLWS
jgi:hypothetical protein